MSDTVQFNVRLSKCAREKLRALTSIYASQRVVIEIAIDRLYASEIQDNQTKAEFDDTFTNTRLACEID